MNKQPLLTPSLIRNNKTFSNLSTITIMEFQASFVPETLALCCPALEETEEIKYLWQAISCATGTLFEKLYTRVIKWNSQEVSPQG